MFRILFLLGLVVSPVLLKGQVKGVVNDEDGKPLIGASVQVLGSSTGVITNVNGRFELDLRSGEKVLVVSFVGYQTDTVPATAGEPMRIQLVPDDVELNAVVVTSGTTFIDDLEPITTEIILEKELLKAACCNLSESFETNASVDVSFTDAVSGAKMIRMLGLDGRYVQINRENIPLVRGLTGRFGINFVPGTWIQSIDVGKGAGSVVNGYESMVGQINLEFKKPELSEKLYLNAYLNSFGRTEINANYAQQLDERWSTSFLLHGNNFNNAVDRNEDGFLDLPRSRQFNLMNRYKFEGDRVVSQLGIHFMRDEKAGGQVEYGFGDDLLASPVYGFENRTSRFEVFGKTGLLFLEKPYKGWGFIYSGMVQEIDGGYGRNLYTGREMTGYINIINQNIIGNSFHQYKTGLSLLVDDFDELYADSSFQRTEIVPGAYVEYTHLPSDQFTLVAGLRYDLHNTFGGFFTPRIHARYQVRNNTTLRASIGMGRRTPNALIDNVQMLVSSRRLVIQEKPEQEVAWNTGMSMVTEVSLGDKKVGLTTEYFYTHFTNQLVFDLDQSSSRAFVYNLNGQSYAHSFQVEASYPINENLNVKTAYKYYDIRSTMNNRVMRIPYVSPHRYFLNASYATKYEKWKADMTLQWYSSKRIPTTSDKPAEHQRPTHSPDFFLLNGQVSRGFRWGSIYVGSENLLDFRQEDPIIDPEDPFGPNFDAGMVWGPVAGRVIYGGIRYKLKK